MPGLLSPTEFEKNLQTYKEGDRLAAIDFYEQEILNSGEDAGVASAFTGRLRQKWAGETDFFKAKGDSFKRGVQRSMDSHYFNGTLSDIESMDLLVKTIERQIEGTSDDDPATHLFNYLDETLERKRDTLDGLAQFMRDSLENDSKVPMSQASKDFNNLSLKEFFTKRPGRFFDFALDTAMESLPQTLAAIGAGLAKGPTAAAAVSFTAEYSHALMNEIQSEAGRRGLSLATPGVAEELLRDEALIGRAKAVAVGRSGSIAMADAISMGITGKFAKKFAAKTVSTQTLRTAGSALVVEPGTEAAGEFAAQLAESIITGENRVDPKEMVAEAIASGTTFGVQAGGQVLTTRAKADRVKKRAQIILTKPDTFIKFSPVFSGETLSDPKQMDSAAVDANRALMSHLTGVDQETIQAGYDGYLADLSQTLGLPEDSSSTTVYNEVSRVMGEHNETVSKVIKGELEPVVDTSQVAPKIKGGEVEISKTGDNILFEHKPTKGFIKADLRNGNQLFITDSLVDKKSRNQGIGKLLYGSALDYAESNKLQALSGQTLTSESAARVWRSLKKKGYPIVENPNAIVDPSFDNSIYTESGDPVFIADFRETVDKVKQPKQSPDDALATEVQYLKGLNFRSGKMPQKVTRIVEFLEKAQRGEMTLEEYIKFAGKHDWAHEMADRPPAWSSDTENALRLVASLDSEFAKVFNSKIPDYTKGVEGAGPTTGHVGVKAQNLSMQPVGDKVVSAPKVISSLEKALAASGSTAPLIVGRIPSKTQKGVHHVRERVARIRRANDISTATHEIAHAVEDAIISAGVIWTKAKTGVSPAIQAELGTLGKALYGSTTPAGGYKSEGFAEFFRLYTIDEATAKKVAPNFFQWFEANILEPNPKFAKALAKAQADAHAWQTQGADQRVAQSIVETSKIRSLIEKGKKDLAPTKIKMDWLEAGQPIYELSKSAMEEMGVEALPAGTDPFISYTAKRLTHDPIAAHMAEVGMVDASGNKTGMSLKQALAPTKGKHADFAKYMYARRALALYSDGKKRDPGISKADATFVFNKLDSPRFQIAAQNYYLWWDGVLDYVASVSTDFARVVDAIRQSDPGNYIPLQREFKAWDQRFSSGDYKGSAKAKGGDPFSKLVGSGRRIMDPFETSLKQASYFLRNAHEKMVIEQILDLQELVPGQGQHLMQVRRDLAPVATREVGDLIRDIDRAARRQANLDPDDLDAVRDTLTEVGDVFEDIGLAGQLVSFFAPMQTPKKGERPVLPIVRDGKLQWYEMDHRLYESLADMQGFRLKGFADLLLGVPARSFRLGTTGLRASFSLVTNPLRDFKTLYYNTRSHAFPPQILLTWMRSMGESLLHVATGGKFTTATIELFSAMGGKMAQPLGQDIQFAKRAGRRLFESKFKRVWDVRNHYDYLREILQFPEGASRISEMKLLMREAGINPSNPGRISPEQAQTLLVAAKQVTTDFTAGGRLARRWNAAVPFFNAQIQGPRAHARAMKNNPVRFFSRGFQMAAVALVLWYRNKDEEWWQEMDINERYGATWLPFDDDVLVKMPRAFEADGIFMAATEAIADAAYHEDPEFVTSWVGEFAKNTFIPGAPVLVEETVEQLRDKDFFFGSPIVPRSTKDAYPYHQYTPYTSGLAMRISKAVEAAGLGDTPLGSPARIDHAIRGIFGGVGGDFAHVFSDERDREKEPADINVIGRLFQRGGQQARRPKSVAAVYDAYGEALKDQDDHRRKGTEESEGVRTQRLLLQDAVKAMGVLSDIMNQHAKKTDLRRRLSRLRTDIAQKALKDTHRDDITAIRQDLEAEKEFLEDGGTITDLKEALPGIEETSR